MNKFMKINNFAFIIVMNLSSESESKQESPFPKSPELLYSKDFQDMIIVEEEDDDEEEEEKEKNEDFQTCKNSMMALSKEDLSEASFTHCKLY